MVKKVDITQRQTLILHIFMLIGLYHYSKLGDGCKSIILRSYVKFSPCTYTKNDDNVVARPRDFTELLSVSVVKVRC